MTSSTETVACGLLAAVFFMSIQLTAQTPDFSCVGFGAATTGGTGGTEVTVTSLSQLVSEAGSDGKKIIKIGQTIEGSGTIIEVSNDKTILGIGDRGFLKGIGFHLKNVSNVIFRNLKMTMIGGGADDIIGGETTSSSTGANYWIDHCEFYNEYPTLPETASKKDKYDGMIDFKKQVSNITISWCYFHDHWKCSLVGYSTDKDPYDRKITYHHNWFKNIKSRTPSYRAGTAHIYNNFYDGLNDPNAPTSEGVHTRDAACLFVEGNYFLNYAKSIYWYVEDSPTEAFVNESGVPNKYVNSPPNTARACNSFTPPYSVTVDAADDVPDIVKTYAGVGKLDGVSVVPPAAKPVLTYKSSIDGSMAELLLPSDNAWVVALYDISGRTIRVRNAAGGSITLPMDGMNSGVYIVSVAGKNLTIRQRIVKK
ncbi:MAG: T9SS type A sorting domain-containing protein [Chitinispirillaceae bacterium]|nr:T9SS type A sorting domain-containing protein [Chitinispirillaceae bacterium]